MPRVGAAVLYPFVCSLLLGDPAPSPAVRNLKLPLAFERQADGSGELYVARGDGYAIWIDRGKTTISIAPAPGQAGSVISMDFAGGRHIAARPGAQLPGKVNYIRGNDAREWKLGLPTYESVGYQGIYPGVDVVYYGNQRQLEFDLVLKPGADPQSIRMKFDGTEGISVDASGQLVLKTRAGEIRLPLPQIYQVTGGSRMNLAGHYKLRPGNEVEFEVSSYDRTKPLVIDPTITYSTLLGNGTGNAIAVDSDGNVYVAGSTSSGDFPTTVGVQQPGYAANGDGFVFKINPAGTALLYSTYLGGARADSLTGIALDSMGAAWVSGSSASPDFPTMNAHQGTYGGGSDDAVVAKLSSTGTLLVSTFLGGSGADLGTAIAVDSNNNAYVTGYTAGPFPTTAGVVKSASQGTDAFVAEFNSSGSLIYSTLVGGAGTDQANGVAVDLTGAYITGSTTSTSFTGAPAGGAHTTNAGGGDAFIAKLNPTGTALLYFTFLGGSGADTGNAITVDATHNAYVVGTTSSSNLPVTTGVVQTTLGGGEDAFVAKLNSAGSSFTYVTYLGGERIDNVGGIALEPSSGDVYITGYTASANFPQVSPLQTLGTGTVGGFETTNSGSLWAAVDTKLVGNVFYISADPATAGVLVASTNEGLSRSTNHGSTWTLEQFGFDAYYLSRSPANSNTLYAGALFGTDGPGFVSTNGGVSWSEIGSGGLPVPVADPLTSTTVYSFFVFNGLGVEKSTNSGQTWAPANSGLPSKLLCGLAGAADGSLYALVDFNGVYKSTNQGGIWTSANTGLPDSIYSLGFACSQFDTAISISPGPSPVIYVVGGDGSIYKSTNEGTGWAPTTAVPNGAAFVAAQSASVVYAASAQSPELYISTDGGTTWNPAATGLPTANALQVISFDPNDSARAYATAVTYNDAFVAKLNSTGKALVYSTLFGGGGTIGASAIATNGAGEAFITGEAWGAFGGPSPFPFPTTASLGGVAPSTPAFVAALSDATAACSYSLSPSSQTVTGTAVQTLAYTVAAPSGCAWNAVSNEPWAKIISGASGTATGTFYVQNAVNGTGAARSALLSLTSTEVDATLTQAASSCTYAASTPSAVGSAGGPVQVNITAAAGCPWVVTNNDSQALTITSGASGTGNGTVNLTVAPSVALNPRTFTESVTGTSFSIYQVGLCFLTLNSTSFSPTWEGGNSSVGFTTFAPGCAWAASSNADWLSITTGTSGNGDAYVGYSIATNTGAARMGTLSINAQTFTVNQGAGTISPVSVSPAAGSNLAQTFTFTYDDPNGYADLAVVNALINSSLDGIGACYVAFAPASATSGYLYLVDDAGDGGYASGSPLALPSSGSLQNSQCTINGTGSSVSGAGNTLTLTLSITFASGFAGNQIVYTAARNSSTGNSGWQALGTWNVPGSAPTGPAVSGVTPARSATTGQTYTFTYTDTNGFADLAVVNVLTNSSLDGIGACYVAFAPTSATSGYLYLVDDAGDGGYAAGSPIALPSSSTLNNSQCTINGTGSSVSASGNTLTLNLVITFNSSFAGNRVFYLAARNNSTGNSGWQAVGSVTVP
jgi:hypothetical protein